MKYEPSDILVGMHSIRADRDNTLSTGYKLNNEVGASRINNRKIEHKYMTMADAVGLLPSEKNSTNLMEELFSVTSEIVRLEARKSHRANQGALDSLLENVRDVTGRAYTKQDLINPYSKYVIKNQEESTLAKKAKSAVKNVFGNYSADTEKILENEFPQVANSAAFLKPAHKRFMYDFSLDTASLGLELIENKKKFDVDTVVYISSGGLEPGAMAAYLLDSKLVSMDYHTHSKGAPQKVMQFPVPEPKLLASEDDVKGKNVMVVDDDMVYGTTMRNVLNSLGKLGPEHLTAAVPRSVDLPKGLDIPSSEVISEGVFIQSSPICLPDSRIIEGYYSPVIFEYDLNG